MNRIASHFMLLGIGVGVVGCVIKIADVSLEDVVSANRRLSGVQTVKAQKRSKYMLLAEQFIRGTKPKPHAFEHGSVLRGRCVFVNRPNTSYLALASVHAGKGEGAVIVTSLINDTSLSTAVSANTPANYSKEEVAETFSRHQLLVDSFTPVLRDYPKELPYAEIISPRYHDSVHFYLGGRELANLEDPNQVVIGFRAVQAERTKSGKEGFVVEHYCGKPEGCRATATLDETHYLQAFAYCYYPDKVFPEQN